MPRRRRLLALAAAGVGGLGAYGTHRYASRWEHETCAVEGHSQSQTVPTGGSFRHYHGDVTHSGFVRTDGSADSGTEYWRTDTGTTPVGLSEPQSVAVADGRVFLTSTWRVLALDQTSGELLWCTEAGRMFMTAPTVSDGTVVFGTELPGGRGGVIAFDAADGTRRWRFPGRGPFKPRIGHPLTVPTVHRGTVYVGGGGGRAVLTALDLADGSVRWQTDLGDGGVTPPAVDGDRLFVQRSGELLALEADDGSVVWRAHAGGPALPPTSTDERVFGFATETGIGAWDSSTGRRQWQYDGTTDEPLSIATDGTDVAVSTLDGVHLLDAETGRARWRKSVERLRGTLGSDENRPARLRGCLLSPAALYLAVDGGFAVLDRDDGSVRWHVEFPSKNIGDAGVSGTPYDPVVVDGFTYLYLENGRVYALGV